MNGREILFDTNAIASFLLNPGDVARSLPYGSRFLVSLITLGELHYGARNSTRVARNLAKLGELKSEFRILLPDEQTAEAYAEVRVQLRRKGRPIPSNDVWIAAIALQHKLPLLTRDTHFRVVDGLDVLLW